MLQSYFEKIKVVELASVLAGPLAGSFFSELGAHVVKVENKRSGGDVTRQWKLPSENQGQDASAYYHSANYNKEVIYLDLTDEDDRNRLDTLLLTTDIVITNYQRRVAKKLGLEPRQLRDKYPKLIIVQLDAYTYEDPRPGFDVVMQAEAGYVSMCGASEDRLAKLPVALMDVLASHQIREATLLALLNRSLSNQGTVVHISLYDSAISGLVNQASNYLNAGVIAKPIGTLHPNIAPYGDVINTKDGRKLILAVGSDKQFKSLLEVLDVNLEDKRYLENRYRVSKREALMSIINAHTTKIGYDTLVALLSNKGIPYGLIKNMKEVMEDDQTKHMIKENDKAVKYVSQLAFKFL